MMIKSSTIFKDQEKEQGLEIAGKG